MRFQQVFLSPLIHNFRFDFPGPIEIDLDLIHFFHIGPAGADFFAFIRQVRDVTQSLDMAMATVTFLIDAPRNSADRFRLTCDKGVTGAIK